MKPERSRGLYQSSGTGLQCYKFHKLKSYFNNSSPKYQVQTFNGLGFQGKSYPETMVSTMKYGDSLK